MRALAVVDGRTDLVVVEGTTHHVYRSTGTGYAPVASHAAHASSTAAGFWADVNGDGLADFVTVAGTTHHVSVWTGAGYVTGDWSAPAGVGTSGVTRFADVNGDGLADYVTFDDASAYIPHISTGITR